MSVQTVSYANVKGRIEALLGDSLTTQEATRLKASINDRCAEAYEAFDQWPSFFRGPERRVMRAGSYIEKVPLDADGNALEWDTIDEVLGFWNYEPLERTSPFCPLDYYEDDDRVFPVGYEPNYQNWFSIPSSGSGNFSQNGGAEFTDYTMADTTLANHSLIVGDLVTVSNMTTANSDYTLDGEYTVADIALTATDLTIAIAAWGTSTPFFVITGTGELSNLKTQVAWISYRTRLAATYGDGAGETSDLPFEWGRYLVRAGYADLLRADGQAEKAAAEEARAMKMLEDEMWRHERKSPAWQVTSTRRTHTSESSR